IDPKIAGHRGRIVKTTGDGLLVEFASVVDALRCAAEVQTALADGNAPLSPERHIAFRIGIHQGDIVAEGGDIFGDGVNVAAASKAWPSRAASASRPGCGRMLRASSTSTSAISVTSSSRISRGRCAPTQPVQLCPLSDPAGA